MSENAQNIAFFTRFVGAETAGLSKTLFLRVVEYEWGQVLVFSSTYWQMFNDSSIMPLTDPTSATVFGGSEALSK